MLEWIGSIDAAWLALIGTILGGSGLKLIESWLNRSKDQVDTASQLRDELRKESKTLREELRIAEASLDGWKERYFMLLQEYLEIKAQMGLKPQPPVKSEEEW